MLREKSKWQIHKDESTDAKYRGGTVCSSDEALVMRVERRGCVIQFWKSVNQTREELYGQDKAV